MISVVIPAFNEEATVGQVVEATRQLPEIKEVVVVDDGSQDKTALAALSAGARVIKLPDNQGKGRALNMGVANSSQPFLLFLDADLLGLTCEHLRLLIGPVIRGEVEMSVGMIDKKAMQKVAAEFIDWPISGMRALPRAFWEQIPFRLKRDFGIESVLNHFAKKQGRRVKILVLAGLTHVIKEKKQGFFNGLINRLKMFGQIVKTFALLKFRY